MAQNANHYSPSTLFNLGVLSYPVQLLLIALAYYFTGKLGNYLAIPPSYATVIWPPSGIALASVLIFGHRIWPGILLGSFLVNYSTRLADSLPSEVALSILMACIIAVGSTVQAIVGAWLVRRFSRFPNDLVNEKDVISFLFLGGFVSTLVNPSLSVAALVAAGRIPENDVLVNWVTWWGGDAMGVLIYTPLVLAWVFRPSEGWRNRRVIITLPIIIVFSVTAALASYLSLHESEKLKFEFDKESAEISIALQQKLHFYLDVLHFSERFFAASEEVDHLEFKAFTEDPLNKFHGFQALSWNPVVLNSQRLDFERSVLNPISEGSTITELGANHRLVSASTRERYVPVGFIEPIEGNEYALGFDIYSDKTRRAAINQAKDSGEITLTAGLRLVQEEGSQSGILALMPIYRHSATIKNLEDRRRLIKGYVVAVFRMGDIVEAAFTNIHSKHLIYRLSDLSAATGGELLFTNGNEEQNTAFIEPQGLFDNHQNLSNQTTFVFGGRQWRLDVIPEAGYIVSQRSDTVWYVLVIGILLTSITGAMALVYSGRGEHLRRLVDERTADLQTSHENLKKLSQQVPGMLYQFKLSATGDYSFPYASEGIFEIYEVTPEQVIECADAVFNVIHPDDYDAVVASIHKSASTMEPWNCEYRVILVKGVRWLQGQAQPEKLEDGSILWHGLIRDITARKQADAIFHGIFEQSQFLAGMLDQHGNLVSVNKKAMSFISYSRESVIGSYFADTPWWRDEGERAKLLEALKRAYSGEYAGFETIHHSLGGDPTHILFGATPIVLDDGVYISITGVDITERKSMEARLRMLSTAIEQGPASVVITNLDAQLEYVNSRFTHITGYTAEEVVGQNPRILQSGLTDASTYTDMWESITHGKRWVGELINQRKNGEIYYEEAYISPVKNNDGFVSHYVAVKLEITERKAMEDQIRQLAYFDPLTQLPNRRMLNDRLWQAMLASDRTHYFGALLFLDLDNFKPLNDVYGHGVGDLLLIEVARRLERCVREMDTVARFGGDEFVVMLSKLDQDKEASYHQAGIVAEKIRLTLSEPYFLDVSNEKTSTNGVEHRCAASIGVALFTGKNVNQDDVIKWADAAMYTAKEAGRNQIKFYGRDADVVV